MSATCPLCGLRYAGQSLLDLHIREDHAQRERGREPPAGPRRPGPPATPRTPGPPATPRTPGPPAGPRSPGPGATLSGPQAGTETPEPAPPPLVAAAPGAPARSSGRPGWAATARRALSRLTRAGRETADRARKAA
jgi:hypothetical protein